MTKSGKGMTVAALLLTTALCTGCGGSNPFTTGANGDGTGVTKLTAVMPPDAPPGITNESPMARPASVAWTSARAKRCAFFFDPVKLRSTYLAYEGRQPGQDLAKVESVYDNTYKLILAKTTGEADYCSDKRSADIKAELARLLANDFSPNLPKPTMVANCGAFGCGNDHKKITDTNEFFREQSKKTGF